MNNRVDIHRIVENTPLLATIILINLAGALIGLFYYWDQILSSSPFIWLFIPDCPLYVMLAAVVLALYVTTKRRSDLINFITAVGLVKYGTWTVFIVLGFSAFYFAIDSRLYSAIAVMHCAMALEFVLPLFLIRQIKRGFVAIALLWFFVGDFADYFFAAHPPVPISNITQIAVFTIVLTPVCVVLAYFGARFLNNSTAHKDW